MIRKLNLLVAIAALAGAIGIFIVMRRPHSDPSAAHPREGVVIQEKVIHIYGRDYTLARLAEVAAELGQPKVLTYNPKRREATANASLIIHGSLQIGDPADPALGETLLLNTIVCGDLQVQVAPGGELRLYHSILQTVSQILTEDKCSRGYYFFADGRLVAADSRILYMSGARGKTVTGNSQADVERVAFALSDDVSFHAYNADGAKLAIRDSQFLCEGRYGVWVEGSGGEPLRLVRCRLSGTEADLYLSGRRPAAELIDCQFSRDKIRFMHNSGRVAVRWTVTVKAVERGTGKPVAGLEIVATGQGGAAETVRGRTSEHGTCPLVLTEYNATPAYPSGGEPANASTPHRIAAVAASGKLLAEVRGYAARGPLGTVTLEIHPDARASLP